MGPVEAKLVQMCEREGQPLPARIANKPELLLGLELFYISFLNLTSCRQQGYNTEGPISWLSIAEYCKVQGIIGDQREDLIYHVQQMDSAYLEYKTAKLKKAVKA